MSFQVGSRCGRAGDRDRIRRSGSLRITVGVKPSGEVGSASKSGGSGLSRDVEQCAIKKLQYATFDPPGGEGATISVPLTFRTSYD